MRERKHIQPRDVVFLVDTREQNPLDFSACNNKHYFRTAPATLATGDYSVAGLEEEIAIERKSLADLIQCCVGDNRTRFEKELHRMLAYPCRLVVVEGVWQNLGLGNWRSKIPPAAVQGSCMRWMGMGIPFFFAFDRFEAAKFVANYMWLHTKKRWGQLLKLDEAVRVAGDMQTVLARCDEQEQKIVDMSLECQ